MPNFIRLLGDGKDLGISLVYKELKSPDGLAQAFIIGEEFIGSEDVCMILGITFSTEMVQIYLINQLKM